MPWKGIILPLNYKRGSDTGSRTRAKAVKEPDPDR